MIIAVLFFGILAKLSGDEFYPISSIESLTQENFFPVENLIEGPGVGFGADEPHNNDDGSGSTFWVTEACGYPCDYYESFAAPVLTIDLGRDRELSEISIWSYFVDNSGKDFTLRFATEQDGPNGFGHSISFQPTFRSPFVNEVLRQSFAFGRTLSARYVEMTIDDNFFQGEGLSGGDRVGLGEVAFAIPPERKERLLVTAPRAFELVAGEADLPGLVTVPFTFEGQPLTENYWSAALDGATGDVYLSVPTDNRIYRGNLNDEPPTLEVFVEESGSVFHGLAVDEVNNLLYVLDSADDAIEVYSTTFGSYFGAVGGVELQRPNEIHFDRERQWLIVSDSGLDLLRIYSPGQGLLYELNDASTKGVWGVTVDPANGDVIYSSHDRGEVWRWNPTDESALPTLVESELSGPRGLGYDRRGNLYCVESGVGQARLLESEEDITFSLAAGGRDVLLYADCDFNGNFLPDDWEAAQESPSLARTLGFTTNHDGDAFSDGLEAALGGDFTSGTDGSGVEVTVGDDGSFEVEHLALKKSDFDYRLRLSQDLTRWQDATTLPVVADGGLLYDTWTFRVDALAEGFSTGDKIFARVAVSIAE